MKKNILKPIKVLLLFSSILLFNFIFAQQKNDISKNVTSIEKKSQTTFLEEQLKTLGAEKIQSLIKNRKVTVESVFNKIKAYKTTSDTKVNTDLLLDLCSLSNSELNILLSKFGEKNEENTKLDVAFANYFKRADALVGQNVFIAGLDKSKSEKLNALNKSILKGDYKRPELIIFGIAERDCRNVYCFRCNGWGCIPYGSSGVDSQENLSKPKCPPGYTLMPNGECAPNEELPSDYPKDSPIKKQAFEDIRARCCKETGKCCPKSKK